MRAAPKISPRTGPFNAHPGCPRYIPELQGLRGLAVLFVVFYHCHPRLDRHMGLRRLALGMDRRQSLLCALGISHHLDPARVPRQAALLPQLLWPPRTAHLAGVRACARCLLSERSLVHRPSDLRRHPHRALVGIHSLSAESLSPHAAAAHRPHVVAGHRRAVLLPLGSRRALPAPPAGCWLSCSPARSSPRRCSA